MDLFLLNDMGQAHSMSYTWTYLFFFRDGRRYRLCSCYISIHEVGNVRQTSMCNSLSGVGQDWAQLRLEVTPVKVNVKVKVSSEVNKFDKVRQFIIWPLHWPWVMSAVLLMVLPKSLDIDMSMSSLYGVTKVSWSRTLWSFFNGITL